MREALIFGGSGQIGRPLLRELLRDGWRVTALSRRAQPDQPGLTWLRGDLERLPPLPARVEAIFSCGPLDAFGRWYAGSAIECARVIALGSTSIEVKRDSADPHERDLAERLEAGERAVFATARERGAMATVLRPTLVYGAGRDANLSRIARLAQRWGGLPLPRDAIGLRQPVHVEDVAAAAFACVRAAASYGHGYDLPGGEAVTYREMVARVLAALSPPPRLLELPLPLFRLVLLVARASGHASGLGAAAASRMRRDLVFDAGPAQRDFGYAPRRFEPTAAMFIAPAPSGDRQRAGVTG